jgi:DsbC/DsbD-like thiol-disulfide interchange protein
VYNGLVKPLFALLLSTSVVAQGGPGVLPRGDVGSKHATVVAAPADLTAVAGAKVSLFVDVAPKPGIHVYAPGSKDYIPISVKVGPSPAVKAGKLTYPKSEMMTFGDEKVPVFQKPFRLTQEVTFDKSAAAGPPLSVAATVHLQACDDRVCYPPETVPVTWNVLVK